MKKICILMICFILMCFVSVPALASDEYTNADELYQAWCDDLPDYITGVWSTDGSYCNLTFGIREDVNVEAVKAEILALVKDDTTVSFAVQKYSYKELEKINDELHAYFLGQKNDVDYGLVSMGIYTKENLVHIEILEAKKNDPVTVGFVEEVFEKYGDAISITYAENYVYLYTTGTVPAISDPSSFTMWISIVAAAVLFLTAALVYVKKRQPVVVLETACGAEATEAHSISVREAETMVRDSNMAVPDALEQKIIQEITKTK